MQIQMYSRHPNRYSTLNINTICVHKKVIFQCETSQYLANIFKSCLLGYKD